MNEGMSHFIARDRIAAFHARHGPECFSDGNHWWYKNGAFRDVHPLGVLADPINRGTPEDEFRNAENVVRFHQVKLAHYKKEFDELNARLQYVNPHDPEKQLATLRKLQSLARQAKKELAEAEKKLAATKIAKGRQTVKASFGAEDRRMEEFQKKRRTIRI
jgi:hypothetical protein